MNIRKERGPARPPEPDVEHRRFEARRRYGEPRPTRRGLARQLPWGPGRPACLMSQGH